VERISTKQSPFEIELRHDNYFIDIPGACEFIARVLAIALSDRVAKAPSSTSAAKARPLLVRLREWVMAHSMVGYFLGDSKMSSAVVNHSARRINHIARALGARRYLEIGVENGNTFFAVDIEEKTAVDPNLLFDASSRSDCRTHIYKLPSDVYFVKHPPIQPFDIVFIDGLHNFDQALRDFLNTLAHLHDRSVVVLDDVWPSDIYSSLDNPVDALRLRRSAGGDGLAWHGDVFKVVLFVAQMMPCFTYRTIEDHGNRQTIFYKKSRTDFVTERVSLEAIERTNYFDLIDRSEIMKMGEESEVLAQVVADLT
jgi:hypothetical protein